MAFTKEQIKDWLDRFEIENYTINNDLTVDVDGCVKIDKLNIEELPFQFGTIKGDFNCCSNRIQSLTNFPYRIEGNLFTGMNEIKSLMGYEAYITGNANFFENPVKSLENEFLFVGGFIYTEEIKELEDFYKTVNKHSNGINQVTLEQTQNYYTNIELYEKLNKNLPNKIKPPKTKI